MVIILLFLRLPETVTSSQVYYIKNGGWPSQANQTFMAKVQDYTDQMQALRVSKYNDKKLRSFPKYFPNSQIMSIRNSNPFFSIIWPFVKLTWTLGRGPSSGCQFCHLGVSKLLQLLAPSSTSSPDLLKGSLRLPNKAAAIFIISHNTCCVIHQIEICYPSLSMTVIQLYKTKLKLLHQFVVLMSQLKQHPLMLWWIMSRDKSKLILANVIISCNANVKIQCYIFTISPCYLVKFL